jgi:hypothetical protein
MPTACIRTLCSARRRARIADERLHKTIQSAAGRSSPSAAMRAPSATPASSGYSGNVIRPDPGGPIPDALATGTGTRRCPMRDARSADLLSAEQNGPRSRRWFVLASATAVSTLESKFLMAGRLTSRVDCSSEQS